MVGLAGPEQQQFDGKSSNNGPLDWLAMPALTCMACTRDGHDGWKC